MEDFKLGSLRFMFYKNYSSSNIERGLELMRSEEEEPDGKLLQQPKGKAKTVTMGQREGNYKDV